MDLNKPEPEPEPVPTAVGSARLEAKVSHEVTTPHGTYTFTFYDSPKWYKRAAWNMTRGWVNWLRVKRFNKRQAKAAAGS